MRTLRFEVDITDEQAAALEEIRPFLVEDGQTGLAPDSTIEEVYVDCAARGLSLLTKRMRRRDLTWFELMEQEGRKDA